MKLFKTLKRKVGNAVLPVVGTILGLTILAGSVVAVALNSSKIVYRQNNLQQQTDARNILYIACKYFCDEKNKDNPATDTEIITHLQLVFGKGIRLTQDKDSYYLWYPETYKTAGQKEWDDSRGIEQVEYWLRAKIGKKETEDNGGDHGNSSIGKDLFQERAKINEIFNIGNMMTTYLQDNDLLPKNHNKNWHYVSKIESDIDTFAEAFAYATKGTTLLVDDIAFEFWGYNLDGEKWIDEPEIIYNTGNLGGNYYWQFTPDNSTPINFSSMVYNQDIDDELMYGFFEYRGYNGYRYVMTEKDNESYALEHNYNEGADLHIFKYSAKKTDTSSVDRVTYSKTSKELADELYPYIYDKNILRFITNVPQFKEYEKNDASERAYDKHPLSSEITQGPKSFTVKEEKWIGDRLYITIDYEYLDIIKWQVILFVPVPVFGWKKDTCNICYTMNDLKNIRDNLGLTNDEILSSAQINPSKEELEEKIFEMAVYNWSAGGSGNHRNGINDITNITFTYDDSKNLSTTWTLKYDLWSQTHTYSYKNANYQKDVNDWINSVETKREALKKKIGYNYIPDTTLFDIVGGDKKVGTNENESTMSGLREQAFVSKMIEYALNDTDLSSSSKFGGNLDAFKQLYGDYEIRFRQSELMEDNHNDKGCLRYNVVIVLDFVTYVTKSDGEKERKVNKSVQLQFDLFFKLLTYHPYQNGSLNSPSNVTSETLNGVTEYLFKAVPIKNSRNGVLTKADLKTTLCPITTLYYDKRDGNCLYVNESKNLDEYINIAGDKYEKILSIPSVITKKNYYYDGNYQMPNSDSTLTINSKSSLFIDGSMTLTEDQKLIMQPGSLLFINGDLTVDFYYELKTGIIDGIINSISSLSNTQREELRGHGVVISANGANILINGNFNYKGIKTVRGISGVHKQRLINSHNCVANNQTHRHDNNECRSMLSGTFIVNGDMNFMSYDNKDISKMSDNFTNALSNPLINATFYVDGIFNMHGLWTSGLYDICRANFVFARSVIQPMIALSTIYNELDWRSGSLFDEWCETNGYLFMIMEDAVNFSEFNFAAVNMFTPYNQLVGALENRDLNVSFDFVSHVDKDTFTQYYSEDDIDSWGLPSILREGLKTMYDAGDIGGINRQNSFDEENEIPGK